MFIHSAHFHPAHLTELRLIGSFVCGLTAAGSFPCTFVCSLVRSFVGLSLVRL